MSGCQNTGGVVDGGNLQGMGMIQRREQLGQGPAQHTLSAPGRTTEEHVVTTCRRNARGLDRKLIATNVCETMSSTDHRASNSAGLISAPMAGTVGSTCLKPIDHRRKTGMTLNANVQRI
jgi:hypothetical protein